MTNAPDFSTTSQELPYNQPTTECEELTTIQMSFQRLIAWTWPQYTINLQAPTAEFDFAANFAS